MVDQTNIISSRPSCSRLIHRQMEPQQAGSHLPFLLHRHIMACPRVQVPYLLSDTPYHLRELMDSCLWLGNILECPWVVTRCPISPITMAMRIILPCHNTRRTNSIHNSNSIRRISTSLNNTRICITSSKCMSLNRWEGRPRITRIREKSESGSNRYTSRRRRFLAIQPQGREARLWQRESSNISKRSIIISHGHENVPDFAAELVGAAP